jgi:Ring finger domain
MSYSLINTQIPFERHHKGIFELVKLNIIESKIDQLLKTKSLDPLKTQSHHQEQIRLFSLRERYFYIVLDHALKDVESIIMKRHENALKALALALILKDFIVSYFFSRKTLGYFLAADFLFMTLVYCGLKTITIEGQDFVKKTLINAFYRAVSLENLKSEDCPICLEEITGRQKLAGHLSLGKVPHVFHMTCLKPLARIQQGRIVYNCPLCRDDIYLQPCKISKTS